MLTPLLLALTLATPRALAGDVLVPEATPAQLSDFSVAYLFYDMLLSALRDQSLGVQDADAMRKWAGTDGDACFDNPDCPRLLWDHDAGGSVLVVLGVGQAGDGLEVTARLYSSGQSDPAQTIHETVSGGGEQKLADKITAAVAGLAGSSDGAAARITPTKPKTSDSSTASHSDSGHSDTREKKPPPVEPDDANADEQRRMGIPAWSYTKFRESGLGRADWLRQARVRTGRVSLEFHGGYALGDVDRGYGVRVLVEDRGDGYQTSAASTTQGPGPGAGFAGTAGVSYAPTWFLEGGFQAGLVLGQKYLNVGWECTTCDPTTNEQTYDPVNSVQGFLEPRVRVLPLATGFVKPYAIIGAHIRFWDGFKVPDGSSVDYPNIPGGAGVGLVVGAGVSFDVLPEMSLVLEAPYSITLTNGAATVTSADVTATPDPLAPSRGLFRATGGVAFHF